MLVAAEKLTDDRFAWLRAALDAGDPAGEVAGAGAQVRSALTAATEAGVERVAAEGRPRAVIVASLGGSAVGCADTCVRALRRAASTRAIGGMAVTSRVGM